MVLGNENRSIEIINFDELLILSIQIFNYPIFLGGLDHESVNFNPNILILLNELMKITYLKKENHLKIPCLTYFN